MVDNRQNLGKTGETIASNFLEKNGYTIVTRNYRRKFGEIDIIARDRDYLVFIEVKTRTGTSHGHPLEAITFKKQRQISKVAQCYLAENDLYDVAARFDVVSVILSQNDQIHIEIIPNAFDVC
jgi:putative endonuclease